MSTETPNNSGGESPSEAEHTDSQKKQPPPTKIIVKTILGTGIFCSVAGWALLSIIDNQREISTISAKVSETLKSVDETLKKMEESTATFDKRSSDNQQQLSTLSIQVQRLATSMATSASKVEAGVESSSKNVEAVRTEIDLMLQKLEEVIVGLESARTPLTRTLVFRKKAHNGWDVEGHKFTFSYYLAEPDLENIKPSSFNRMEAKILNVLKIDADLAISARIVKQKECVITVRVVPGKTGSEEAIKMTEKTIDELLKSGEGVVFSLTMSWRPLDEGEA